MSEWRPRRFWTTAHAQPAEGGFQVLLDTRPLRTPAKAAMVLPSRALAQAVAEEWDAQETHVEPAAMPFTRMVNSAIDKVAPQHAAVTRLVADYGASDLLCYRADGPATLVRRQQAWDAPLDWAARTLGARLVTTTGVMPIAQDPAALARLDAQVLALSNFELAAFHDLVALSGSLVLGFAAAHHALPMDELWSLSRLDEDYQAELWGHDEEAAKASETRRQAFQFAREFLDLSRD